MIGGGRYDNLTGMFGGEPISGIGFGMGDVTMRDFLETHNLLPDSVKSTAPKVMIIPMSAEQNLFAEKAAMNIRRAGHSVATDISTKKVGDKISRAGKAGAAYALVIGENEANGGALTLKNLESGEIETGDIKTITDAVL
jgi:histidyl-tRNA synthetase